MTKQEFIDFLKFEESEREFTVHWKRTYSNSDDYWTLYVPARDWLEDTLDLTTESVVKIECNKNLATDSCDTIELRYDEFVNNYNKTT